MAYFYSKSQVYANTLVVFALILFLPFISLSQNRAKAEKEFKKALEYLQKGEGDKAIPNLEKSLSYDATYPNALLALGEVYYSKKDSTKQKSFIYYKRLIESDMDFDNNAHFRLGENYIKEQEFDLASYHLKYFLTTLKLPKDSIKNKQTNRLLKQIEFMLLCLSNHIEFNPKNLGENINSENDEYLPSVTVDEQSFIFTRFIQRKDIKDRRVGEEDFYISYNKDGAWVKAYKMSPPFNVLEGEGALSIAPDGHTIYFTRCRAKDGYGRCDIYYTIKQGSKWSEPKNLGPNVNSSAWDAQPTIASDGRTLFFVSNREGGLGKSDIWYSVKNDKGEWSKAKNIGTPINTEGEEQFPFIHPSNSTLYFSSDYHVGMGGKDVFYSRLENGKFTEPINLGCPINTAGDETSFIVTPSGKQAIYSSDMQGGFGGQDLYMFDLYKEAQPTPVVYMKGNVYDKNTNQPIYAKFEVKDIIKNRLVASTISDAKTGEYLVVLPLGAEYALNAQAEGYLFYSENFKLTDVDKVNSYQKDIKLTPIVEGETVVLKNVFFATNSAELLPTSIAELNALFELLQKNPTIRIEISGHTDNTGNPEYNMELSNKRANSVKVYLEEKGISKDRLISKGYGQTKPISDNNTEEGKAHNRRTEFKILKK